MNEKKLQEYAKTGYVRGNRAISHSNGYCSLEVRTPPPTVARPPRATQNVDVAMQIKQ